MRGKLTDRKGDEVLSLSCMKKLMKSTRWELDACFYETISWWRNVNKCNYIMILPHGLTRRFMIHFNIPNEV